MRLTIQRMGYFWFPRMRRREQTILMGLFTVGAVVGLIRFLRSGNDTAWLFLGVLVSYSLIYYLVVPQPRYRCPIDWVLIFLTSFWICSSRYFLESRAQVPVICRAAHKAISLALRACLPSDDEEAF